MSWDIENLLTGTDRVHSISIDRIFWLGLVDGDVHGDALRALVEISQPVRCLTIGTFPTRRVFKILMEPMVD